MGQVTAKTILEVMWWIETTTHNKASKEEEPGYMVLTGHNRDKLRVPRSIWNSCFVIGGEEFDTRMYRWDHKAHRDAVNPPKINNSKIKVPPQDLPISTRVVNPNERSVEDRVAKILVDHLGVEPDKLIPSASIIEDLGADSLDTVELVMALEEELNMEVTDDEAETIRTVKDAVEFVKMIEGKK